MKVDLRSQNKGVNETVTAQFQKLDYIAIEENTISRTLAHTQENNAPTNNLNLKYKVQFLMDDINKHIEFFLPNLNKEQLKALKSFVGKNFKLIYKTSKNTLKAIKVSLQEFINNSYFKKTLKIIFTVLACFITSLLFYNELMQKSNHNNLQPRILLDLDTLNDGSLCDAKLNDIQSQSHIHAGLLFLITIVSLIYICNFENIRENNRRYTHIAAVISNIALLGYVIVNLLNAQGILRDLKINHSSECNINSINGAQGSLTGEYALLAVMLVTYVVAFLLARDSYSNPSGHLLRSLQRRSLEP